MKRKLTNLLLFVLSIGALLGIFFVLFECWNNFTIKLIILIAMAFFFTVLGICNSVNKNKKMSLIGMIITLISYLLFVIVYCIDEYIPSSYYYILTKVYTTIFILPMSLSYLSLLSLINNKNKLINKILIGTKISFIVFFITYVLAAYFEIELVKLFAISFILTLLGTVLSIVMNKLNK